MKPGRILALAALLTLAYFIWRAAAAGAAQPVATAAKPAGKPLAVVATNSNIHDAGPVVAVKDDGDGPSGPSGTGDELGVQQCGAFGYEYDRENGICRLGLL